MVNFSVNVVEMPQRQGQQRWEFKESATDIGTVEFRLKEAIAGKLDQEARNAILDIVSK